MALTQRLRIASRFNGPKPTGNGGYSAGSFAGILSGAAHSLWGRAPVSVRVSLAAPPPLEHDMLVEIDTSHSADGMLSAVLKDGETLIATAETLALTVSCAHESAQMSEEHPAIAEAITPAALALWRGQGETMDIGPQSFGHCFVCGHKRHWPNGLCLYARPAMRLDAAPVPKGAIVSDWSLHESFQDCVEYEEQAGAEGFVRPELIWAALDCPGYYTCCDGQPALLANITVTHYQPLPVSRDDVFVAAWPLSQDGTSVRRLSHGDDQDSNLPDTPRHSDRKRHCRTVVIGQDGTIYAEAKALWVLVSEERLDAMINSSVHKPDHAATPPAPSGEPS